MSEKKLHAEFKVMRWVDSPETGESTLVQDEFAVLASSFGALDLIGDGLELLDAVESVSWFTYAR